MQASIDFDGTLTGRIAGGGGGGSDVSITPTYNQGTKIADYSIDGNEGAIYTPEIEISKNVLSGVKICEIEGVEIFAPSYGYIDTLGDSNVEQIGGFSEGLNVTPVKVKRVSYTNDVSNGEKIGSLVVGDSSYNVYQKPSSNIDYSTTEQNTGKKWIDGRDIYQITFYTPTVNSTTFVAVLGDSGDINLDILVNAFGSATYVSNGARQVVPIPQYFNNEYYIRVYVISDGGSLIGTQYSGKCCMFMELSNDALSYYSHDLAFTIEYVKAVE